MNAGKHKFLPRTIQIETKNTQFSRENTKISTKTIPDVHSYARGSSINFNIKSNIRRTNNTREIKLILGARWCVPSSGLSWTSESETWERIKCVSALVLETFNRGETRGDLKLYETRAPSRPDQRFRRRKGFYIPCGLLALEFFHVFEGLCSLGKGNKESLIFGLLWTARPTSTRCFKESRVSKTSTISTTKLGRTEGPKF